jgi:hypothetical protein
MIGAMSGLLIPMAVAAAAAQPAPSAAPPAATTTAPAPAAAPAWNPAAPYVTAGQDEPGYRAWYAGAGWRRDYVRAFNDYLVSGGVAGVVPTWQLLRTATSWQRCGGQPFEVPPSAEWPHIVQTLRYIHYHVVPAVGPVEAVSGYRNPQLNHCAGGAPESAHKSYSAIDLVPLRPTSREELMQRLCAVHAREGSTYGAGLGFYAFLRFHVDTTRYRRWGVAPGAANCPAIVRPADLASVAQPDPASAAQPGAVSAAQPGASDAQRSPATAPPPADTAKEMPQPPEVPGTAPQP